MAQGVKANISFETLKELLEKYTIIEVANILNVSTSTIQRYKNKYKLKTNLKNAENANVEKHTKYFCNKNYFDKIDSLDKAYLLGFLCADGFVTDRNEIGIGVSEKDRDVVEFFQSQLESNKPIKKKDGIYNSVELRIQNKYLVDKVKEYGIVSNKSLILDIKKIIQTAQLDEKQISVFLLGYFDGDGCISLAHRQNNNKEYFEMNITGTLETVQFFKEYFDGHGSITKRHKDDKNNYTLQMSNNFSTIYKALSKIYLYSSELTFYLKN